MTRNGRYVGVSAAADPSKVLQELPFFHIFSLSVRFGLVKKKKLRAQVPGSNPRLNDRNASCSAVGRHVMFLSMQEDESPRSVLEEMGLA